MSQPLPPRQPETAEAALLTPPAAVSSAAPASHIDLTPGQQNLQQGTALSRDLLDRLQGFATQAELQELRDQVDELIVQLNHMAAQPAAPQQTAGISLSLGANGSSWVDSRSHDGSPSSFPASFQGPATTSTDSDIFAASPDDQLAEAQGRREQQVRQWQERQSLSPRLHTQRQANAAQPRASQANSPELGLAPIPAAAPSKAKATMVDRAQSSAFGSSSSSEQFQPSTNGGTHVTPDAPAPISGGNHNFNAADAAALDQQQMVQAQSQGLQGQQQHQQPQQQPMLVPAYNSVPATTQELPTGPPQRQAFSQQQPDSSDASRASPQQDLVQSVQLAQTRSPSRKQASAEPLQAMAEPNSSQKEGAVVAVPVLQSAATLSEPLSEYNEADMVHGQASPSYLPLAVQSVMRDQAAWIQRSKLGAPGGTEQVGEGSLTVNQLAASLQTVAGVVHAMALGPPTQSTSATTLVSHT